MRCDGYQEMIDLVWDKPPKNVGDIIEKIIKKYPVEFFSIKDVSYMMIVKINEGFYGISWICTHPDKRNNGYMSSLMIQVLDKYKGVFFAKTTDAMRFYKKFGFKQILCNNSERHLMILINDASLKFIDF